VNPSPYCNCGSGTGSDFGGTVLALGPGLHSLHVGDSVVGLTTGCLGSQVVVDSKTLARLPAIIRADVGSSLPTVAITSNAAFNLTSLGPGDR